MNKLKKIAGVIGGLLLATTNIQAAGTSAGSPISNQATVSYNSGAGMVTANSSTVTFRVQELVKGAIAKLDAGNVSVSSPQDGAVMKFKIRNDGNGSEGFAIIVNQDSGDDFDVIPSARYIDNGDGIFDIAVDTLYDNSNPPAMAPDDELTIWITSNIPAALTDAAVANLNVNVVPATFFAALQDNPSAGDVIIGGGDNGTDAVNAVAISSITSTFIVSDINVSIAKIISATRDLLGAGGSNAVPGAEVDYTLTVTVTGSGVANNVVVNDQLPDELKLKDGITGTITVGGDPKTASNTDNDGTAYDANTGNITVELGDINAGNPDIAIQFTTVIQ